jgi:hypothetical protein
MVHHTGHANHHLTRAQALESQGGSHMNSLPVRKEVQDFIRVSETLLSPELLASTLTPEECELIAEYVMSLSRLKHPWSKSLVLRYAWD